MSSHRHQFLASAFFALAASILGPASVLRQICSQNTTNCTAQGHSTMDASSYPWTQEISFDASQPVGRITLNYNPNVWTVLQTGCTDLGNRNIRISTGATASILLSANLAIESATAANGSLYEVQLMIDSVVEGWYLRRIRGIYPDQQHFEAVAPSISSGNHTFAVKARLLNTGSITFNQQWIVAQGVPNSYPSAHSVNQNSITISSTGLVPVSNQVSFNTTTTTDLAVQSYFVVTGGLAGDVLTLAYYLDGRNAGHTNVVGVPPVLYDSISSVDHIFSVGAGSHTLQLYGRAAIQPATVTSRQLEFLALPGVSPGVTAHIDGQSTGTVRVDSRTTQQQPFPIDTTAGNWTKLLTLTVPSFSAPYNGWLLSGYVQLLGNVSGSGVANMAFLRRLPDGTYIDLGIKGFNVTNSVDGQYMVSSGPDMGCGPPGCSVELWMRVNKFFRGDGAFDVGTRSMMVKILPQPATCIFR